MSNVKLGIRVRPFTERELRSDKEQTTVVSIVNSNTVTITNVKVSVSGAGDSRERVRRYYADYTFDSACPITRPSYASQQKVFDTIGREVSATVVKGCSACVLAYGQSATGKTHTMMGTELDPGLVPRICRALSEEQSLDLTVSFLEIYNERVHDLLAGESAPAFHSLPRRRGNARKDLRVREHPARGPYVQNLRRVSVQDVDTLLSLVNEGGRRRRTAATKRNPASSRSHALIEIATRNATLHLADLAGSEKAGWEGCGGRQKEGANINKSLVALSNVISALVSGGIVRGRFVPYRDSALTWLLKDCFTGGASTFIIATVSPSVSCYGESASTLRWAERARQLPTARPARTSGNARAVLHVHYTSLIAELARNFIKFNPESGKLVYDENHWKLPENILNIKARQEKTAKIGNIMNLLHPKAGGEVHSESTASSVASGSSDVINTMDKNIKIDISSEISKEVDKLFGPALERTQSNSDLKIIAPLRHKRRQYKSQEVLPIDEKLNTDMHVTNVLPSHNETQIKNMDKATHPQVPILYDSQRAEIVASVTERLYNKIKKKEEAAASKVESVIEKKIMEPLNELRICTNARQRLVELSQKAIRNKRKIGIPAHTQTRKIVTRVRDQGVDAQTDLEAYIFKNRHLYTLRRDAATETMPMTPRCKEAAVGSKFGTLNFNDRSTITEEKKIIHKSSLVMTDIVRKCDVSTQTIVVPPPRRKRRSTCYKCMQETNRSVFTEDGVAPVISINISQAYPADSETQSSDDNSDIPIEHTDKSASANMTPDLLTNHNTVEAIVEQNPKILLSHRVEVDVKEKIISNEAQNEFYSQIEENDDFPDTEDCELPRVTIDYSKKSDPEEIKDIILGRNENTYPYNIILSPPRDRDESKRLVKFVDDKVVSQISAASQTNWDLQNRSKGSVHLTKLSSSNKSPERPMNQVSNASSCSDSTESSKAETDSFVWKKTYPKQYPKTNPVQNRSYNSVYKSKSSKYAKAKAKLYREFLGLDNDLNDSGSQHSSKNSIELTSSDSAESRDVTGGTFSQRKNYLEDKLRFKQSQGNSFRSIEQEILHSCNSLETSVNRYENYLSNYQCGKSPRRGSLVRTPTEYLQHLVQLRREMVKADCDTDNFLSNVPR